MCEAQPSWRFLEQGRRAAHAPSDLLTAPLKHSSCARVKNGELESSAIRLAAVKRHLRSSSCAYTRKAGADLIGRSARAKSSYSCRCLGRPLLIGNRGLVSPARTDPAAGQHHSLQFSGLALRLAALVCQWQRVDATACFCRFGSVGRICFALYAAGLGEAFRSNEMDLASPVVR